LGFHYPRSQKTVNEINKSKKDFLSFFSKKVFDKTTNYYLIANKGKINFKKYKKFLDKNRFIYKNMKQLIKNQFIENSILSNEKILNYFKIKKNILAKIKNSSINLKFNRNFLKKDLIKYDKVIVATYSNNNKLLHELGVKNLPEFKFQLVEKILIKLPKKYQKKSFVVMDGDFVCLDPYLGTKYHLLSDVKHSKLETKIGKFPNFKNTKKIYLNKGIIKNRKVSQFDKFISKCKNYLPFLKEAKYIGSMFVVRAIKKNKENTDERTSSIYVHSNKIMSIFSGKWNNCVYLAKTINNKIIN
jgi:D-amino-acid oxidase